MQLDLDQAARDRSGDARDRGRRRICNSEQRRRASANRPEAGARLRPTSKLRLLEPVPRSRRAGPARGSTGRPARRPGPKGPRGRPGRRASRAARPGRAEGARWAGPGATGPTGATGPAGPRRRDGPEGPIRGRTGEAGASGPDGADRGRPVKPGPRAPRAGRAGRAGRADRACRARRGHRGERRAGRPRAAGSRRGGRTGRRAGCGRRNRAEGRRRAKGDAGPKGDTRPKADTGPKGDPGGVARLPRRTRGAPAAQAHRTARFSSPTTHSGKVTLTVRRAAAARGSPAVRINEVADGNAAHRPPTSSSSSRTRGPSPPPSAAGRSCTARPPASSDTSLATIPTGTTIPPGAFYLLGGAAYAGAQLPTSRSRPGSPRRAARSGFATARARSSTASAGEPRRTRSSRAHAAPAPPTTAAPGASIVRLPDGHDTNDNSADLARHRDRRLLGRRTADDRAGGDVACASSEGLRARAGRLVDRPLASGSWATASSTPPSTLGRAAGGRGRGAAHDGRRHSRRRTDPVSGPDVAAIPPGSRGRRHLERAQEEVFVVLDGTLTMLLGDPPERVDLCRRASSRSSREPPPAAERERRRRRRLRLRRPTGDRPGRVPGRASSPSCSGTTRRSSRPPPPS